MKKAVTNLKIARNIIRDNQVKELGEFQKIHSFTTENIKGSLETLDLKDKDILTVLSSSDQLLEMFLRGARSIDTFDINPLTEEYLYLKIAAILSISKTEFIRSFNIRKLQTLPIKDDKYSLDQYKLLTTMEDQLSHNSYFWEAIFAKNMINISKLFYPKPLSPRTLPKVLTYLDKDNYKYLRNNIADLNHSYVKTNLLNIPQLIDKKYDLIYLSNIIEYANSIFKNEPLENMKELINNLSSLLNPNGKIVSYIYSIETESTESPIWQPDYRNRIFTGEEYSYEIFQSIDDIKCNLNTKNHDACLIYTKK